MRLNRMHNWEELEKYILMYLENGKIFRELRKSYGLLLPESAFNQKMLQYQKHGRSGIQSNPSNNLYSREFKKALVIEHYNDRISLREL